MKRIGFLLAMALGASTWGSARAELISFGLGVSDNAGINFNGNNGQFTFTSGTDFTITSVGGTLLQSGAASKDEGMKVSILGTFQIGSISNPAPGYQTASVTTVGSPNPAELIITDKNGVQFTASLSLDSIDTVGATGGINSSLQVNLTNMSYSGTNQDLLSLLGIGSAALDLSFSFSSASDNLTYLTTSGTTTSTDSNGGTESLAGTIVADPAPAPASCILMLTGGFLSGLGFLRRRIFRLA